MKCRHCHKPVARLGMWYTFPSRKPWVVFYCPHCPRVKLSTGEMGRPSRMVSEPDWTAAALAIEAGKETP